MRGGPFAFIARPCPMHYNHSCHNPCGFGCYYRINRLAISDAQRTSSHPCKSSTAVRNAAEGTIRSPSHPLRPRRWASTETIFPPCPQSPMQAPYCHRDLPQSLGYSVSALRSQQSAQSHEQSYALSFEGFFRMESAILFLFRSTFRTLTFNFSCTFTTSAGFFT